MAVLEFLVQDTGAKEKRFMKKIKARYTHNPEIGELAMVKDTLPKASTTKITITLDSASVNFFKQEADRLNSSYQRMMRNLLTEYANRMKDQKKSSSPR